MLKREFQNGEQVAYFDEGEAKYLLEAALDAIERKEPLISWYGVMMVPAYAKYLAEYVISMEEEINGSQQDREI